MSKKDGPFFSFKRFAQYIQKKYDRVQKEPEYEWLKPVSGSHILKVNFTATVLYYTLFTFFLVFIVWASFFEIDEYVHASGEIIPESDIKILNNFDGGIVKNIYFKEGDVVQKGQVILELKQTTAQASYLEGLHNYYFHWAQMVRLKAQIDNNPLELPQEIKDYSSQIAQETQNMYANYIKEYQNEQNILEEQLEQSQSAVREGEKHLENLQEIIRISEERLRRFEQLVKKELVARTQYDQVRLEVANHHMEMDTTRINLAKARAAQHETEEKLHNIKPRLDMQDWQSLKEHQIRYEEAKKIIVIQKDHVQEGKIRAPVTGVIQLLTVKTIGSSVTAGKEFATIVPLKDSLWVEALVLPQDIGFVNVGNRVTIKVSAFDYSIYGPLKGIVETISPDSFKNPQDSKQSFYKVHIRTPQDHIDYQAKKFNLTAGMTVQVDILTGKRTIMHYLLKPLIKTVSTSLGER